MYFYLAMGIFFAILVSILIVALTAHIISGDTHEEGAIYLLFCILFGIFVFMSFTGFADYTADVEKMSYKKGQIDAINGQVHYVLKTNCDGSTTWQYKK